LFDGEAGKKPQQAGKEAGEGSSPMSREGGTAAGSQRGSTGEAAWFMRRKRQGEPTAYVRAGSGAGGAETQRGAIAFDFSPVCSAAFIRRGSGARARDSCTLNSSVSLGRINRT